MSKPRQRSLSQDQVYAMEAILSARGTAHCLPNTWASLVKHKYVTPGVQKKCQGPYGTEYTREGQNA